MLPYFSSETYHLFGLTLRTWGTFVAAGYALGTYLAWRRAKQRKLDAELILDLAFWIFIGAFIGARFFHVLFYEPSYYLAHPFEAIDPRQPGYAMFGGLIGAAAVFFFFLRQRKEFGTRNSERGAPNLDQCISDVPSSELRAPRLLDRRMNILAYADTLVWGLPWGCGVGRIGCFLIHDHPGTLTHFILGVRYPDGTVRHDLGLYLSIIGFATGGAFLFLNRRERRPGFWFGAYMIVEGLTRFALDFLRVADVTYFGLTPTQYLALPLAFAGWLVIRRHKHVV